MKLRNISSTFLLSFLFLTFLFIPFSLFANSGAASATTSSSSNTGGSKHVTVRLDNPIGNVTSIPSLIQRILKVVLKIGVPLIALSIIYTGYLFIVAQGSPEKLKKAKETFFYTILGALILLGAYAISEAIVGTMNNIIQN